MYETEPDLDQLRYPDLVAKMAKVHLKDTIRVMLATRLLMEFFGLGVEDLLQEQNWSADKPTQENSDACEAAAQIIKRAAVHSVDVRKSIKNIKMYF